MEAPVFDFLNSQWRDWRGSGRQADLLDRPEWWAEFLARWGLPQLGVPDPGARQALGALRTRLRSLTEQLGAGDPLTPDGLAQVNQVLALGPARRHLSAGEEGLRLDLHPVAPGWDWVMAQIAASFAQVLVEGDVRRLKICHNPDCRWVYYDQSKNRARRWCDDSLCGNLMKVRRFRARRRDGEQGQKE